MRRNTVPLITLIAAGLGQAACAHVEVPPGGPEDNQPPAVLTTRPDAEAVVPRYDGPVVFVFDERISERGVEDAVLVSPRTSPVVVQHGRDEVRVSLRRGWEPGQIYQITLRPEIVDLFGNRLAEPTTLVFSTGPDIPRTDVSGVVTDRLTGRPRAGARVEAVRTADSVVYAIPTDSAGQYVLNRFPPGEYQVRAFEDVNRNRSLDPYEPRDSAFLAVVEQQPQQIDLRMVAPDSTAALAGDAIFRQERIVIEFDDYLDPDQLLDPSQVAIADSAGLEIAVGRVTVGPESQIYPAPDADADTATIRLPARQLFIDFDESVEPIPESDYRVIIRGLRNVNGLDADIEVNVTSPAAPPGAFGSFPDGSPIATLRRVAQQARIPRT